MNFQNLNEINKPEFYVDTALKRGDEKARLTRSSIKLKQRLAKSKAIELKRIEAISDFIKKTFLRILQSYPNIDDLHEFYQQLIRLNLDYPQLKKSLGAMNWVAKQIEILHDDYHKKIKKTEDSIKINQLRREYIGRAKSLVKRIKKELEYLEYSRKIMTDFPSVKTKLFTVAIVGFPNIGKTTLLSNITDSKPEINLYPFTTKKIMVGTTLINHSKVQFLDTPGTLNRFDKMNNFEKQSFLAIKYCTNAIIFIYDLTGTYPLEQQEKLREKLMDFDKPMIYYLSKTDLLKQEEIDNFKKSSKLQLHTEPKQILEEVKELFSKDY